MGSVKQYESETLDRMEFFAYLVLLYTIVALAVGGYFIFSWLN